MPRQPDRRSSSAPAAGGTRDDGPFAALAKLRGKGGKTAPPPRDTPRPEGKGAPTGDRRSTAADRGADPTPDDLALFRAAVDDTTPLRANDRVELSPPKPPPLPRPRAPESEAADETPRRKAARANDDEALLRAALEDVTPLKDTGRLDIGPAPRRGKASATPPATPHAELDPLLLLSPADGLTDPAELFRHAMRGAQPIDTRNRVELERPAPAPEPLKREADEDAALRESLEAPLSFEDRLDMGDEAAFLRPGLPRRVLTDLRRGRWVLQGEIDLHGLTREEAREALARFLAASLQQGRRCVRVIHGKGLRSPGRFGILKHLSRGWLAQREEILAFCQAGPHAGGSGALLVLLRAGVGGQGQSGTADRRQ